MDCRKQYLKEGEISMRHIHWDGVEQNKCIGKKHYCPDTPAVAHVRPGTVVINSILLAIKLVCWYFENKQKQSYILKGTSFH